MEPNTDARRRESAFTLIEIMVVIAILGLLLTIVGSNVWQNLKESKVVTTKAKLVQLGTNAISNYRRHHHKVPDTLDELLMESDKNFGESYASPKDLRDSWDNQFRYERLSNSKCKLISLGADGMEGGEYEDADIIWPDFQEE